MQRPGCKSGGRGATSLGLAAKADFAAAKSRAAGPAEAKKLYGRRALGARFVGMWRTCRVLRTMTRAAHEYGSEVAIRLQTVGIPIVNGLTSSQIETNCQKATKSG